MQLDANIAEQRNKQRTRLVLFRVKRLAKVNHVEKLLATAAVALREKIDVAAGLAAENFAKLAVMAGETRRSDAFPMLPDDVRLSAVKRQSNVPYPAKKRETVRIGQRYRRKMRI